MGSHGASCSGRSPHTVKISSLEIIGLSVQPPMMTGVDVARYLVGEWHAVREEATTNAGA